MGMKNEMINEEKRVKRAHLMVPAGLHEKHSERENERNGGGRGKKEIIFGVSGGGGVRPNL